MTTRDQATSKRNIRESAVVRWMVLFILSMCMGASYYFYDALSPLKQILTQH
ncbi:MAG: hypothetical protein HQK54_17250, partial [Oligoflexales bacterium]|nr:hypothetical protein [Oligoflexales bacterium]